MKTTPTEHYFRIKEQVEYLVFNENISLTEIYIVLQEAIKMIDEALKSTEERLNKERSSKNGKETQEEKEDPSGIASWEVESRLQKEEKKPWEKSQEIYIRGEK